MKRVLVSILLAATFLQSCKKDDNTKFDKSPDERLNEKLGEYQTLLSGAQYGWKGLIITDSTAAGPYQGNYSFYFKFDNANRVKMYSDWDSATAVTAAESSYRLKALQQPSLIFDTYSYVHLLSDPDPQVSGGDPATNAGLYSDFEFYFDSSNADYIKLVGRINKSRLILTKATQQEAAAFESKQLGRSLLFNNINKYLNYFKQLIVGGVTYEIKVDVAARQVTLSWVNASGNIQTFTTSYYYSITGVTFANPLVNGNQTFAGFSNFTWDAATTTLGLTVNGTATTVVGSGQPIKVDLTAPQRWWQTNSSDPDFYWFSWQGFHVNGVDDAYNVQSLQSGTNNYYYMVYWPRFATGNDVFAPVFLDLAANGLTFDYGTAPRRPPTFTSDGRAIFTQLGNYGTYPTTGPAALSRTQLYNASGYYFVQTSASSYDMVSAVDGKTWITWEY